MATTNGETAKTQSVIVAAGGIVIRRTRRGPEVLVVYRPKYQDWSLPKGKFKPRVDKTCEEAAIREVGEETGQDVRITGFDDVAEYSVKGRPKVVLFWHMAPVGKQAFKPSQEVERVAWWSAAEAEQQLTYATERRIVSRALARMSRASREQQTRNPRP